MNAYGTAIFVVNSYNSTIKLILIHKHLTTNGQHRFNVLWSVCRLYVSCLSIVCHFVVNLEWDICKRIVGSLFCHEFTANVLLRVYEWIVN